MFAVSLGAPARAADVKPELEFQPSSVSLVIGVGQQATALVVVHNPTNATLREVRLSWLPRPSLDVQPPSPLTLPVLAPHADYVWTLTIKPSHGLPTFSAPKPAAVAGNVASSPGTTVLSGPPGPPETRIDESLDFLLQYKTPVGGREETQVVLKSLTVKTQDLGDLDKALDVQIKTALETLESSESGSIYLVLKNNTARTISVTSIAPIAKGNAFCPDSKTKSPQASGQPEDDSLPFCFTSTFPAVTLSPYQTVIEELLVRAHQRVKAGKYLLVLQIATQSYEGGVPLRRNVIVSQAVDVNVLGESAILKVADLPSFFLLPGALFLLTIAVLWQTKWLQVPPFPPEFPLEWKEPGFWLVSLTLSLLVAILPWLWTGKWYFTNRRGLQDVALLWFASILAGVAAYVAGEWLRNLRMPAEQDTPLDALRKLQLRRDGFLPIKVLQRFRPAEDDLVRKRVKLKGKEEFAFVLAGSDGDEVVWVCPPAQVTFHGAAGKVESAIRNQIDNNGGRRDLHTLFVLLHDPSVMTAWQTKPVDKVSYVTKDQIESWNDEDGFIQLE